jgi:hypothetical protein
MRGRTGRASAALHNPSPGARSLVRCAYNRLHVPSVGAHRTKP